MTSFFRRIPIVVVALNLTAATVPALAQVPVPRLVKFTGAVPGGPGPVELTFSLYAEQGGETPLWTETQRVTLDDSGRYAVLLGSSRPDGLPADVFASGEARWLGVRVAGGAEQPRVALVSVPYALKAADAETVGGRPLSAFVLAGERTGIGADGLTYVDTRVLKQGLAAAGPLPQGAGTPGAIGRFIDEVNLGDSVIFQNGWNIGIGTTVPAAALHSIAIAAPGAIFDVYSNSLGALPVVYRAARGTPYAPNAVQTDDILGGLAVRGYGATGFTSGRGQVMFKAAENWTDTANGTYLQFTTTQTGTTTWAERMRITPRGFVGIGTTDPRQELTVNGSIESLSGGFVFPDGTRQTTAGMAIGMNAAFGTESLSRNTTGTANTAFGQYSLAYNTTGTSNTAVGYLSLQLTTTGGANTAVGEEALRANSTGFSNVSVGHRGLYQNTTGNDNAAVGYYSLSSNTVGYRNVALGSLTLGALAAGSHNTAVGHMGLRNVTSASYNSAVGAFSLYNAGVASGNSAFGEESLYAVSTGSYNTAVGAYAGGGIVTGSQNTYVGYNTGTLSSFPDIHNATAIGAGATVNQSDSLVLGNVGANAVNVGINITMPDTRLHVIGDIKIGTSGTNGCVKNYGGGTIAGTCSSDARLKTDVRPFEPVLGTLAGLEPVRFRWRAAEFPEYHFGAGPNVGLIAQDVEKVLPEMVSTDENGYKQVNYSELPLVTLAAVRELKAENDALKAQLAAVLERLAKLEKAASSRQ